MRRRDFFRGDEPFVSDNITHLRTIPIAGAISANFQGNYMYVTGVEGLSTFDISNLAAPKLTSLFPLPHFENEDVTLGGGRLLIANDNAEGVGVLYVFDIATKPGYPKLVSQMPTGGDILLNDLPSHTVTCIKDCQYAYMAGTGYGIAIVDLRNPTIPEIVGRFTPPITGWATHDVQVDDSGLAWIAGQLGTAAYDVTDPLKPVLVGQTDTYGDEAPLNDFIHHNSLRLARTNGDGKATPTDVVLITEEDYAPPAKALGRSRPGRSMATSRRVRRRC